MIDPSPVRRVGLGPALATSGALIKIVAIVLPLMGCVAYLTLWERKAIGWIADPHRARTASARSACCSRSPTRVKLLIKEIILPTAANKGLFLLGPIMTIMPALAAWAVIPFGARRGAGQHQRRACCS